MTTHSPVDAPVRDCPSCSRPASKVYAYEHGRVAYCSHCQKTYSPGPRHRDLEPYRPPTGPMHGPHCPDYARGPEHATPCSYPAAHLRVSTARGRATDHACAYCGDPAEAWALSPDADERWITRGPIAGKDARYLYTWSLDIHAYRPLCWPCHWAETDTTRTLAAANAERARAKAARKNARPPRRRRSLIASDDAEAIANAKPCPRCNEQPTSVYEYAYGDRIVCLAYCAPCTHQYKHGSRVL